MSLNTIGEAFVGRNDVAYYKEGGIPQESAPSAGPTVTRAIEEDQHEGYGYKEQEYTAPAIRPPGQSFEQALTRF